MPLTPSMPVPLKGLSMGRLGEMRKVGLADAQCPCIRSVRPIAQHQGLRLYSEEPHVERTVMYRAED